MAKMLTCPCGEQIIARDDEIVTKANAHLEAQHEGRTYPDDMILAMTIDMPDSVLEV